MFLCVSTLSYNIAAQNFGGGITIGVSTSQVTGDNLAGFRKAGVLFGVFANRNISTLLSIQMEMNYVQKGSNNPNMNDIGHPDFTREDISSSYIEIPLLLQYHQSEKIKIEAGVLTGYLIDAYYNDLNGRIPSNENPFINYDIGVLIGLDYKYASNISLNTRISNSILPIGVEDYNNQNIYNTSTKGKYNSVLIFSLHYNF